MRTAEEFHSDRQQARRLRRYSWRNRIESTGLHGGCVDGLRGPDSEHRLRGSMFDAQINSVLDENDTQKSESEKQ
jgi:hypothetical protein